MDFLVFINTDYWPKMITTLSFLAIWYLIGPISVLSGKRGGWGLAVRVVNNSGCWRDQHGPRSSSSFIITGHHFLTERWVKGLITHTLAPHCVDTSSVASHTNRERHSVTSWHLFSPYWLWQTTVQSPSKIYFKRPFLSSFHPVQHTVVNRLVCLQISSSPVQTDAVSNPHLSANPQLSLCFTIQPSQEHFFVHCG